MSCDNSDARNTLAEPKGLRAVFIVAQQSTGSGSLTSDFQCGGNNMRAASVYDVPHAKGFFLYI